MKKKTNSQTIICDMTPELYETSEIYFNKEINSENAISLMLMLDSLEKPLIIYFSTPGGAYHIASMLINVLNNYHKKYGLTLIFTWGVNSIGFRFITESICNKKLMDCHSIIHLGDKMFSSLMLLNKESMDAFEKKLLNKCNAIIIKKYLLYGITNNEIKKMSRGENVYLNQKRLQIILDNIKKKDKLIEKL